MNVNNQSSTSLKQIRLQVPIGNLDSFTDSLQQLREMYPKDQKKNDEE